MDDTSTYPTDISTLHLMLREQQQLIESCKANKVNPLTYLTHVLSNARSRAVVLPTPDEFGTLGTAPVGECALKQSAVRSHVKQDADFLSDSKFDVEMGRTHSIMPIGSSLSRQP